MLSLQEEFQKEEKERIKRQLESVLEKTELTPEELWELYPQNYTAWCKKHYYPKLIEYFIATHYKFKNWMEENEIDSEFILEYGITNCIAPKKMFKDKSLYVIEVEHKLYPSKFIGCKKINRTEDFLGHRATYKTLKKIISYSDWSNKQKIKVDLLNIRTRTAPAHQYEEVYLADNFKLLKLGGVNIPTSGYVGLSKNNRFEFVNVCSLKFSGVSNFGSQIGIECSYSAADHLHCSDTNIVFPKFEFCEMTDIKIVDSKIQQWDFYDCNVDGEIKNTDLINIRVFGGNFHPIFKDVHIQNFEANQIDKSSSRTMGSIYKSLKKIYSDQGEDKESVNYFLKEKEIERRFSKFWKKLPLLINFLYWGYGRKPGKVICFSIITVFIFSIIYFLLPLELIRYQSNGQFLSYWDCLYTSFVSFTTLGFSNIEIFGLSKILVGIESFLGGISIGFIVAGFSNFKY